MSGKDRNQLLVIQQGDLEKLVTSGYFSVFHFVI